MLRGGLGLTVSPFRGIFWYSPVLLLGLIGAVPFTRRHRWEGIAFLVIVALHILGYSRYLYWSGGVAWGARYMLPIIPFLLLLAAPVFAWLVKDQETATTGALSQVTGYVLRIAAWLLIAWSSVVAILGILFDWRAYELPFLLEQAKVWGGIGEAIDATYMNPAVSPVVGHIRLLLSGAGQWDFAWTQQRAMGETALVPQGLLLSLGLVGLALAALVWIWRRPERAGLAALLMTGASVAVASLLLLTYRQGDARFDAYDVDRFLQPIMARLEEVPCGWQGCDQVALVPDPALTDYFLNYLAAPLVWYGIDYAPLNVRLMERLGERYGRIWLVRDRNAASDDAEGRRAVERWLVEHAFKLDEQRSDDWARLVQFSAAGRAAEIVEPGQTPGRHEPGAGLAGRRAAALDRPPDRRRAVGRWGGGCPCWRRPATQLAVARRATSRGQLHRLRAAPGRQRPGGRPARPLARRWPIPHRGHAGRPDDQRQPGHRAGRAARPLSPDRRPVPRRRGRLPATRPAPAAISSNSPPSRCSHEER